MIDSGVLDKGWNGLVSKHCPDDIVLDILVHCVYRLGHEDEICLAV